MIAGWATDVATSTAALGREHRHRGGDAERGRGGIVERSAAGAAGEPDTDLCRRLEAGRLYL